MSSGFGGAGASAHWQDEPITFASARTLQEWESGKVAGMTRVITIDGAVFAADVLGWIVIVTSIWRSVEEDRALGGTGVHVMWRAIDLRSKDRSQVDVNRLVAYLNGRYIYDVHRPAKPVAYGDPHGNGPHVHVQSHPNTTRREAVKGS